MTTRGRYLRLHVCIDNRRALALALPRRGCGAAREFPMTVPAAAVQCASALTAAHVRDHRRAVICFVQKRWLTGFTVTLVVHVFRNRQREI